MNVEAPAIYYSPTKRDTFSRALFIVLIVIHVVSLLVAFWVSFVMKVRVILLTIDLLNFLTLLYIYGTYGLYNVLELSSGSARALQHFIYPFGEALPEGNSGAN